MHARVTPTTHSNAGRGVFDVSINDLTLVVGARNIEPMEMNIHDVAISRICANALAMIGASICTNALSREGSSNDAALEYHTSWRRCPRLTNFPTANTHVAEHFS